MEPKDCTISFPDQKTIWPVSLLKGCKYISGTTIGATLFKDGVLVCKDIFLCFPSRKVLDCLCTLIREGTIHKKDIYFLSYLNSQREFNSPTECISISNSIFDKGVNILIYGMINKYGIKTAPTSLNLDNINPELNEEAKYLISAAEEGKVVLKIRSIEESVLKRIKLFVLGNEDLVNEICSFYTDFSYCEDTKKGIMYNPSFSIPDQMRKIKIFKKAIKRGLTIDISQADKEGYGPESLFRCMTIIGLQASYNLNRGSTNMTHPCLEELMAKSVKNWTDIVYDIYDMIEDQLS